MSRQLVSRCWRINYRDASGPNYIGPEAVKTQRQWNNVFIRDPELAARVLKTNSGSAEGLSHSVEPMDIRVVELVISDVTTGMLNTNKYTTHSHNTRYNSSWIILEK